jgi:hypothetical protein
VVDAAELFSKFLQDTGLVLRFTEQKVEGSGLGRTLFGYPDLVLGPKPVVVDAKWGGFSYRRKALENGTATQLAFYAHLLAQQDGFDEAAASVAFFILGRGQILTTDPDLGAKAEVVSGPSHTETWRALERAFDARKHEIAKGRLFATANAGHLEEAVVAKDSIGDDGAVVLKPNCQWCDYGGLCGATLNEARS